MYKDLQTRKNRLSTRKTFLQKVFKYFKTSNNFKLII